MPETKTSSAYLTEDGKMQSVEATLLETKQGSEVHIFLGGDIYRGSFRFTKIEAETIVDALTRLLR